MSGWGSWLGGADAEADAKPNFRAVTDRPQDELYGQLEPADLEWACAGGFATETQVWYTVLEDGALASSQIIHSSIGLWYPQIQITFKYFNPKTGQKVWKSTAVTHFVTPPGQGVGRDKSKSYDKRSCKADQFTVLFDEHPDGSESYTIDANMDTDLQLSYTYTRPASCPGWKLGSGPEGSKSYFGTNTASPDGYVLHKFWPRVTTSGHIIYKGQAIDAKGTGVFIRAIQGMRPNLVASRWNFANFQSIGHGDESQKTAAIMMEFTTTSDYGGPLGSKKDKDEQGNQVNKRETMTVNIGSVIVGDKLVAVTGSTRKGNDEGSSSSVKHLNTTFDPDTGYQAPGSLEFAWSGPLLEGTGGALKPVNGTNDVVNAKLTVDLGKPHPASESKGLVEKVDVLGEIPYMVRKVVNYVAGTKPYVYQNLNPATLSVQLPESYKGEGSKSFESKGTVFTEATFISEP